MRAARTCRSFVVPRRGRWGKRRGESSRVIWITTTGMPMTTPRVSTFLFGLLAGFALSPLNAIAAAADAPRHSGYEYFQIGDLRAATPDKTRAGLMLMG